MTRVMFLGTAAALPTGDRGATALALIGDPSEPGLLIDCGDGVYRALLRAEIGPDAIGDLLITHAHIDHLGALPSLLESWRLAGRRRPLRIFTLPETLEIVRKLLDAFSFEFTLDDLRYPVHMRAADEATELTFLGAPARLYRMDHSVPSAGVRINLPEGAFAYTCDTQPNPNIEPLGRQARLLVTECTYLHKNVEYARMAKHMTALEAGQQAALCGVESLALAHLGIAADWSAAAVADEASQAYTGPVIVPQDGDALQL